MAKLAKSTYPTIGLYRADCHWLRLGWTSQQAPTWLMLWSWSKWCRRSGTDLSLSQGSDTLARTESFQGMQLVCSLSEQPGTEISVAVDSVWKVPVRSYTRGWCRVSGGHASCATCGAISTGIDSGDWRYFWDGITIFFAESQKKKKNLQ